jgi:hypothetical protein
VVETNIHHPSDSALLEDGTIVIGPLFDEGYRYFVRGPGDTDVGHFKTEELSRLREQHDADSGSVRVHFRQRGRCEPYKRDLKTLEFHLLDTGHFALEEDGDEIADLMRNFPRSNVTRKTHEPTDRILGSG